MRLTENEPTRVHECWGRVLENIASDSGLVEALQVVCEFEQQQVAITPSLSHAALAWAEGERQGIANVFEALTDPAYIRKIRASIREGIEAQEENV